MTATRPAAAGLGQDGRPPLLRLLAMARPLRDRLLAAVAAGAAAADLALLILDEPTAHLDPASRRALIADLLHATEDRSVLFITHEPDGLNQVDEIVVLDRGRVIEHGSHQQLRHAGGHYQRIWESEYEHVY